MKFVYQARTKEGDIRTGIIEASSKEAALSLLQRMNLFVTYLEEKKPSILETEIKIFRNVSLRDLANFSRQLSILLSSQVPIVESLLVLASQTKNSTLKEIVYDLAKEVDAGSTLSKALLKHKKVFPPFFIGVIKSGEVAGKLSTSSAHLAEHLEREFIFRLKTKEALIYPTMIFVLFVIISSFLVISVLPQFERILLESQAEVPFLTRMLLSLSSILRKHFLPISLILLLSILSLFYYFSTEQGKEFFEKILFSLPILGSIFKNSILVQISKGLSTLLAAGLTITEALEIIENTLDNKTYKTAISKIKEEVKKGNPISSISRAFPDLFPPIFNQMVLVGEKTGTLSEVFKTIGDFYQSENERSMENFARILEPTLIILMAFLVGGLLVSVLLPLYRIIATY